MASRFRSPYLRVLLPLVLLIPAAQHPIAAQDTLSIAPGRGCPACRVSLRHVVSLGADAGVHGPMLESRVARDSEGRYFVGPTYTPGTVAVYGADGRFQRAFGTRGNGPGEFAGVRTLAVGPGDSLWVVSGRGRVSVLSPGMEVARELSVQGGVDALLLDGGGRAVARVGRGAIVALGPGDAVGEPVPLPEQDALGSPFDNALLRLPGGRLAAPQGSRYRLDVIREDGTHERVVLRETTWFPETTTHDELARREATGEVVGAIAHAAARPDGRVWILAYRLDMSRMPELEMEMERTGASMPSVPMLLSVVDPVLELLDLETGTALATGGTSERFYTSFMDGDHVIGIRELEDGNVVLDVWALSLQGGG